MTGNYKGKRLSFPAMYQWPISPRVNWPQHGPAHSFGSSDKFILSCSLTMQTQPRLWRWTVNWKGCGRTQPWTTLTHCPAFCHWGGGKQRETSATTVGGHVSANYKWTHDDYNSDASPLEATCLSTLGMSRAIPSLAHTSSWLDALSNTMQIYLFCADW